MYRSAAAFTDSTTPATSPFLKVRADLGQIDEDHVAQRVLRMQRDADDGGFVVFDVDPLVVGGVHGRHGCVLLGVVDDEDGARSAAVVAVRGERHRRARASAAACRARRRRPRGSAARGWRPGRPSRSAGRRWAQACRWSRGRACGRARRRSSRLRAPARARGRRRPTRLVSGPVASCPSITAAPG